MRLLVPDFFDDGRASLPGGGHLELEPDGRMLARGCAWSGHVTWHPYDRRVAAWNADGTLAFTVLPVDDGAVLLVNEKAPYEAALACLGDPG